MKLTQESIKFIDNWLQFSGINYLDVRYELVDHLVTEYEQSDQEISIEIFVKDRLNWCKTTAKKRESSIHWGIQKGLWRRFLSLFRDFKIVLPVVFYLVLIVILKENFSSKTMRFLLFTPVLLTIGVFFYHLVTINFSKSQKDLNKKILGLQKLETLFALPQFILSVFYYPWIWTNNNERIIDHYLFMSPCVLFMTMINIAAILEYVEGHKKLKNQIGELMNSAL